MIRVIIILPLSYFDFYKNFISNRFIDLKNF
jgi:hypothetical protein